MANRTRDYYRKMRKKAINRKRNIIKSYRQDNPPAFYNEDEAHNEYDNRSYGDIYSFWYVKNKGMLSKGKIHCSCCLCAFHGTTVQDRRKLTSMESELNDYYNDEDSIYIPNLQTLKNKFKKEINGVYHPNASYPGTTIQHHSLPDYEEFEKETKNVCLHDTLYEFMCSLERDKNTYKYMCHAVMKFLKYENIHVETLHELHAVLNCLIADGSLSKYESYDSKTLIDITSIHEVASILDNYL